MTAGRVPDRDTCVLRNLVDRHAAATPDKPFAVTPEGVTLTYAGLRARVRAMAGALQRLGVAQGDHVLVWLPNGLDGLVTWFAINYAGAVYVPINTAYRGGILEHVVRNSGARLMIAHGQLAGRLAEIATAALTRVVVAAGDRPALPGLEVLGAEALAGDGAVADLDRPVEPWDTQSIIYTSGTTGPSKGVLSSYAHLHAMGTSLAADREGRSFIGPDDRFMVNLPMFHVGGTAPTYAMLVAGGSVALLEAFDTASFWRTVEATQTTVVILLGVMASFLVKEPVRPGERQTPLRNAIVIPFAAEGITFRERFGVTTRTLFNMSEVSCPLIADENPTVVATCGKPRRGRAAPPRRCPRCRGGAGRDRRARHPHRPALGAEPWLQRQPGSHRQRLAQRLVPHGRCLPRRWRRQLLLRRPVQGRHPPAGRECLLLRGGAGGLRPSCGSRGGGRRRPQRVRRGRNPRRPVAGRGAHARSRRPHRVPAARMAHFMVPRYVRILDDLPKTPTRKVEKYLVRQSGITPDTWDREKAGIAVRREKLSG